MQVKHPEVYSLIESISQHYSSNVSNRFTHSVLSLLPLDSASWTQIEELTERASHYRYQGYHFDELYSMILAMAKFISFARKQGIPLLKSHAGLQSSKLSSQDKILLDMVINNFISNLNILADYLNKLFVKVVELDKAEAVGRPPVLLKFPELKDIGKYLLE
ncbi:MAG TPA: hypothetical protein PK074_11795 [Spirochaetales bacterium]|nr:hypothetical protein [Spirochaetales bacterium]HQK35401.1 hypothetical protein [Spirochaetales bacterium]HRV28652.1 hypothetical protein [Spirochaetia bacterium]